MICRNCLRRFASPFIQTRSFTTQIPFRNAAEPFTVPASMSPSTRTGPSEPTTSKDKASQSILRSSVPAGTALKGLNFYKDKQDPIAMEDTEYPDWLWGILAEVKGDATGAGAGPFIYSFEVSHI
jgi:hypothetical protein